MNEFLIVFGMFLVTFGIRYPVLTIISKVQLPEIAEQALKFVPPAVLMAIIAPAVLLPEGNKLSLDFSNAALIASILSVFVAWRTKNLLLTIIIGMAALWLWKWLIVP
jgi:branched-subunit amino acid transport protein